LSDGRKFYDDARSEFNGCIDYLRAGLARQFVRGDAGVIAARLAAGEAKVERFVEWANRLEPSVGAVSFESLSDLVEKWLSGIEGQNQEAIELLRADLDSCRMREWRELGR
jgi:hypothetical protein